MVSRHLALLIGLFVLALLAVISSVSGVTPTFSSLPKTTTTPDATDQDMSTWKTYHGSDSQFSMKYPPEIDVQGTRSVTSPDQEKIVFKQGASTLPITLLITDLGRYLPTTNTPTLSEYLATLKRLRQYKVATISGKKAYEYLSCGRAECAQEVVFIHDSKQYAFSIEYRGFFKDGRIDGNIDPTSITFKKAPAYIQKIIESVQFVGD